MIDGNISMEEDTELRDLVVQTLENNGVLAKVRAELRASVFLALEEQESVMNPEPLLNKTVKQYLSNSEGKLLFSLVREFLEYFGLEYTISVYDPETYFGKEYNYIGRNKLCEELGINSTEPLLGEILKSSINGALNNTRKDEADSGSRGTVEASANFANSTFAVSVPKMVHAESISLAHDNDSSDKLDSISEQSLAIPINVTITDKKNKERMLSSDASPGASDYEKRQNTLRENSEGSKIQTTKADGIDGEGIDNIHFDKAPACSEHAGTATNRTERQTEVDTTNRTTIFNKTEPFDKVDESVLAEAQTNQNDNLTKQNNINSLELRIVNNVQNKKSVNTEHSFGRTVYFEEIIVDGKKESVATINKSESFLGHLPPLDSKANSIFADLPPLNGKKTNINDLKELMDIGLAPDGVDNYEEDFVSSASGSANEQSPSKDPDKPDSPVELQMKKEDKTQSARSEDISEEIEEIDEILSSTSCLEDVNMDKSVSNFSTGITADYIEKM